MGVARSPASPTPTCLWSKEFYETGPSRGFVRGYTFQFGRGVGPVVEAVASEAKGLLPWGAGHHAAFRRLNGHRLGLSAICEDLPEEHNRVTLDPARTGCRSFERQSRLHQSTRIVSAPAPASPSPASPSPVTSLECYRRIEAAGGRRRALP
jgi:hypothetical protein